MYRIYEDNPQYAYGLDVPMYVHKKVSYDKFAIHRYEIIKGMHKFIQHMNDERAYEQWCYIVPDKPTDEDLMECANDAETFNDALELFMSLIAKYGKSGVFFHDIPSIMRIGDNHITHCELYAFTEGEDV